MIKKILYALALIGLSIVLWSCGSSKPVLHIFTWAEYFNEDVIKDFEDKFNCRVVIDTFDSNETMYSKIKGGGLGYDLITPSSYMAKLMYNQKMIDELDLTKTPNMQFVDKNYLQNKAIDQSMKYSVPYMIGFTVIVYNEKALDKLDNTWALFDNPKFKKRMTILNDVRETIGSALKYKGYKLNSTNDAELAEAKKVLLGWRENISKFDSESYKQDLASGESLVAQGYSGDVLQLIAERPEMKILFPKEGGSMSCDDFVIPVSAPNKELAYAFINFLYEPENSVKNMRTTNYFCPNVKAKELLNEEDQKNPGINTPQDVIDRYEVIDDVGEEISKLNKIWDEIRISN